MNSQGESAATTPVSVTLAPGSGGNTVSGTVTFPGSATGHTLYVGVYGNNGIYSQAITSPMSPQAYSFAGVPSGTYQNFAIIDMNDDGEVDPGDIDNVGNHTLTEYRHVLTPMGTLVMVGGPSDNSWLGPLTTSVKAYFVSPFVKQKMLFMLAQTTQDDLNVLRDLMQAGKLTPVIDRRYPLAETAQAIGYLEQGHAKGKVIITVDQSAP